MEDRYENFAPRYPPRRSLQVYRSRIRRKSASSGRAQKDPIKFFCQILRHEKSLIFQGLKFRPLYTSRA